MYEFIQYIKTILVLIFQILKHLIKQIPIRKLYIIIPLFVINIIHASIKLIVISLYFFMNYLLLSSINLIKDIIDNIIIFFQKIKNIINCFIFFNVLFFILKKQNLFYIYYYLICVNSEILKMFFFILFTLSLGFLLGRELKKLVQFIIILLFFNLNTVMCKPLTIREHIRNINNCVHLHRWNRDILISTELKEINCAIFFTLTQNLTLIQYILSSTVFYNILFLTTENLLDLNYINKSFLLNFQALSFKDLGCIKYKTEWHFTLVYDVFKHQIVNNFNVNDYLINSNWNFYLDNLNYEHYINIKPLFINKRDYDLNPSFLINNSIENQYTLDCTKIIDIEQDNYPYKYKRPNHSIKNSKLLLLFCFCNLILIRSYVEYSESIHTDEQLI